MSELADYGIDLATLQQMYNEWKAGAPKSHLEEKYLHKTQSHGKAFSSLTRRFLGQETEGTHPLTTEVARLREENLRLRLLLTTHGINPDEMTGSKRTMTAS